MKKLLFFISVMLLLSLSLNILTVKIIHHYENLMDSLPQIASAGFITGCNRAVHIALPLTKDSDRVVFCQELTKHYQKDLEEFLNKL